MANIVITKTGESIIVVFNDYEPSAEAKKRSYFCDDIVEIELPIDESHVFVMMRDAHNVARWYLTYDAAYVGNEYFIVDSVDGVPLSSQDDLFNKITALR